ncbi:MAG: Bug family tripartite tricarboxylate transporter substrate binding protein [Tropicimonas sp.]|uniref:Bug family tripartite tricarboxylate transporter substrate binding protein n=1 Tax=Tropicimonas sp. TaxID=2067044 RepID=UPI003A89C609
MTRISNITRRMAILATGAALLAGAAQAQGDWPQSPVKLIVPYPPGGNTDLIARTLAEPLSAELGQPVVVENRAGAGGTVGVGEASRAAADGYTLVVGDIATMGINPHVYDNLVYDPLGDFAPVIQVTSIPLVLGIGPRLEEVTDLSDLIARAKADPEYLDYASAGVGTAQHLAFEYFRSLTGIEALHIPYKGSAPARTALMAGEVGAMIDGTLVPMIRDGSIRALAVTAGERVPALPDVPTMKEQGVDMVYTSWHGILAPAGTDPAIIGKVNAALDEIMARPEIAERFTSLNIGLVGGSPEDFGAFVTEQAKVLGDLVELSGAAGK